MLLSALLFAHVNALAKYLSLAYPTIQILWVRFAFHALLLILLFGCRLPAAMASRSPGLQLLRSFFLLACTGLFFLALHLMPLTEVTAILFLAPILVTALSAAFLGEAVGARRWLAVAAGFLGTMLIIRPGTGLMQPSALVALGAAGLFALFQILSRVVSRRDGTLTTLVYTPLAGAVGAGVVVPFVWVAPDAEGWGLFLLLGTVGAAAQYTLLKAFETAEASVVSPIYYSILIWAALLGIVLFDEIPGPWTVAGAAVIVASGLYISRQEHVRRGR